jgi:hypothetical protein
MNEFHLILQRLAKWMIIHNVFRPGLRVLLHTISTLKKTRAIDAVIMYTNQAGEFKLQMDNETYTTTVPQTLVYMMEVLNDFKQLFDCILMRTEDVIPHPNGWFPKTFSRILDHYPQKPKDIRQMVFVDDLSAPKYILADDIPDALKSEESWYPITPYFRNLSKNELRDCMRTCFKGIQSLEKQSYIAIIVLSYYEEHYRKYPSSAPNAKPFLALSEYLIRRFRQPIPKVV